MSKIRKVVVVQTSIAGFESLEERIEKEHGGHLPPAIVLLDNFGDLIEAVLDGATMVVAGTQHGDACAAADCLSVVRKVKPTLAIIAYAQREDLRSFEGVADHLFEKKPTRGGDDLPRYLRRYLEDGVFEPSA